MSLGNTIIAVILGVIAFGFVGILGVLVAFSLLAVLEMTRYTIKIEDRRDAAVDAEVLMGRRLTHMREERDQALTLKDEQQEVIASLRSRIASENPSLELTLATLVQAQAAAEKVVRHRVISESAPDGWPVIELAHDSNTGYGVVTARPISPSEGEVVDEPLLLDVPGEQPVALRDAYVDSGQISAMCLLEDLPDSLRSELVSLGRTNPQGCRIVLEGLATGFYRALDTDRLENMAQALRLAVVEFEDAIKPSTPEQTEAT